MQAAYEAGPSGLAFTRDSHVDLVEEDFGLSLLSAIEDGLGSVESNWQVSTFPSPDFPDQDLVCCAAVAARFRECFLSYYLSLISR